MDFTLCLTHDCNLRCAYCYAGRKFLRIMTWDVAKRAVDFALENSIRPSTLTRQPPKAQLGYFGGEPLLEWDLLQQSAHYAISESARLGITLKKTLTTNTTLLDADRFQWLCDREFYLGLSMDGDARMHDAMRLFPNGAGSHAHCERALRFITGPAPRGEVIVVVDPRNVKYLADSVAWLISRDVRSIALNPNFYIDWPDDTLATWQSAYDRIADAYIECYRHGHTVRINLIDGKIRVRLQEGYDACDKCGFGESEVAIAPSGNIYPCERIVTDDSNAELCIGNVFDGFDKKKRTAILACRGNKLPECQHCSLKDRCMNWCSCINYATTGAINMVNGLVCHHERMSIAVADRVGGTLYKEANPAFMKKFYGA